MGSKAVKTDISSNDYHTIAQLVHEKLIAEAVEPLHLDNVEGWKWKGSLFQLIVNVAGINSAGPTVRGRITQGVMKKLQVGNIFMMSPGRYNRPSVVWVRGTWIEPDAYFAECKARQKDVIKETRIAHTDDNVESVVNADPVTAVMMLALNIMKELGKLDEKQRDAVWEILRVLEEKVS